MILSAFIICIVVVVCTLWLRNEVRVYLDRRFGNGCPLVSSLAGKAQEIEHALVANQQQTAEAMRMASAAQAAAQDAVQERNEDELMKSTPPLPRRTMFGAPR